jgi:hypothetical protein
MAFEESIANAFNLDDENWLRHANPASVWSRAAVLPIPCVFRSIGSDVAAVFPSIVGILRRCDVSVGRLS